MSKFPSIFNEVIGPVMRGPSSSHTAASWRIAKICKDIFNNTIKEAVIEFDKDGSWAGNYREQGTSMGINGGLAGLDITDDRMKSSEAFLEEVNLQVYYKISSFRTDHSNTIKITLKSFKGEEAEFIAVSTGGGAFEIKRINDYKVSLCGDYYELLIFDQRDESLLEDLKNTLPQETLIIKEQNSGKILYNFKSKSKFRNEIITRLKEWFKQSDIIIVDPILPVVSGYNENLPFDSMETLLDYSLSKGLDLGNTALIYEEKLSGLSKEELKEKMRCIISIIDKSIFKGLSGTVCQDRILPQQSHLIKKAESTNKIIKNSLVNNIIKNVTAIMEAKSALEVIVANPTAGSCGTIGGALKAIADELKSTEDEIVKAYFSAGIIGAFFTKSAGFSAEEYGCQVECGAASGMAAAGIVQLMGGSAKEAISGASIAIQNMLGLICDPVADRVEVPCLGKNISAAMNALSSAIMARSGYSEVIPFTEVMQAVLQVGSTMPKCVKCIGEGGLAITKTSKQIKKSLEAKGKK